MIVFTKFILVMMAAAVLLLGGQQIIGNNILERGPVAVLADENNCANDPKQLGCENPGTVIDITVPDEPAPSSPPSACSGTPRDYNECIACNTSQPVHQDKCGVFTVGSAQFDGACSSWCQQQLPSCQTQRREYPQCGGTTGLEGFPASDTIMVTEITDCSGNKRFENRNLGNLGQCQVSRPKVTSQPPVQQPPAGAPAANVNNNLVQNTVNNTVNQSQTQSNTQTVTVQQPTQGGFAVRFATVDCPSGTTKKVKDNEIICEVVTVPKVVEVAGAKVEVKELPKTGLPLLAWAAGAFIPAGWGLKRFGKGISFDMEDNANYLWEERQFKFRS